MTPTFEAGLIIRIALLFVPWINKFALFVSVIFLNPLIQRSLYGASFWLGIQLLGPVGGVSPSEVSLSAGVDVLVRLFIGGILGFVLGTIAPIFAYHIGHRLDRRDSLAVHTYNLVETDLSGGRQDY